MKTENIPGNNTPAPAVKAENISTRDKKKEIAARSRARRLRSIMKLGLSEEEVLKMFDSENVRTVLCLYYGSFTFDGGTREMKKVIRGKDHKVIKTEMKKVPNILRGRRAVEAFLEKNNLTTIGTGPTYCWIKTDKDNVDKILEFLKPVGRTSVTAPEKATKKSVEKNLKKETASPAKPTNNTAEVKKKAKDNRKQENKKKAEMRPYYAAWRKGGVSARIKKYNKTLADKIEAWIAERKKALAEKQLKDAEHRAKHRQLTSMEMKAQKRARIVSRRLAATEQRKERDKKRMEKNIARREKCAQKAQKHAQTELKMAA